MLIKDIRQVRRRVARSVYRAQPISHTAVRWLIRYLDKGSVDCTRYDIGVILLCNTGMRGSNLSVRASSAGDEHEIKLSIARAILQ